MRLPLALLIFLALVRDGWAAQPPEQLLPPDTLFMVAVPDAAASRQRMADTSLAALWQDPAMRAFREKFLAGWKKNFQQPLEQELELDFSGLFPLLQGPAVFAVTRNGLGEGNTPLGLLLMLDAKEKGADLKQYLEQVRQKWAANPARTVRTEEVRGLPFSVLVLATNQVPQTLRRFFPGPLDYQEIGQEPPKPNTRRPEIFFGQVGSVLVVANAPAVLERAVDRLTGGASPSLAEQADFQAHQRSLFREAGVYAWVHAKPLYELWYRSASAKKENPLAPNPFELFDPARMLAASGLAGLQSVGLALRTLAEGMVVEAMLGVPDAQRTGVFRVLAGEPREANVPAFIPADVVKFQRWRIDGQKTWGALEKMLAQASPQTLNSLNFIIDTANLAASQKHPGFDLRKALVANLGDDLILYEKAAREGQPGDPSVGPALYLVASPNPEVFAASVQHVLILVTAHAGSPQEREFLGRKILSVPMPALNLGFAGASTPGGRTLHYAGGSGYVAFSTDAQMVEEFLRRAEGADKNLRDRAGLAAAAERVLGPGASYFRYSDSLQALKPAWESLRKGSSSPAAVGAIRTVNNLPGMKTPDNRFTDWLDFSLLPPFADIARHLSFTVAGNRVNVGGLTYTLFAPQPPPVKPPGS